MMSAVQVRSKGVAKGRSAASCSAQDWEPLQGRMVAAAASGVEGVPGARVGLSAIEFGVVGVRFISF